MSEDPADSSIEPECGALKSLFGLCGQGDSLAAPVSTNATINREMEGAKDVQSVAQEGGYGETVKRLENTIARRQAMLKNL